MFERRHLKLEYYMGKMCNLIMGYSHELQQDKKYISANSID